MNPMENVVVELQSEHALKHKIEHHESLLTHIMEVKPDDMHFFKPDFDRVVINPVEKKIKEDQRFDFLLRMKNSLNESFDNPGYVHPHGMTEYDYRSVPEHRRPGLEHFKMRARRDNYTFQQKSSEIDALLSLFIQKLLKAQPTDPIKFAGEFFTLKGTNFDEFSKLLEEEKIKLKTHRTGNLGTGGKFSGWSTIGMKEVNEVKSLNLGPVAGEFCLTPRKIIEVIKATDEVPPTPEQPKKKYYCGCKDKGRREFAHPKKPPGSYLDIQKCDLLSEGEWGGDEEQLGEYEEMSFYSRHVHLEDEEEELNEEDNRQETMPFQSAAAESKTLIEEDHRRVTMLSHAAELKANQEHRRSTTLSQAPEFRVEVDHRRDTTLSKVGPAAGNDRKGST